PLPFIAASPKTDSQGLIMPEDKFHKLADDTIHDLLEKLEEYGDSQQMDGFDIDYGNQVLTLRLGDLGTYVVNKQTPNRQIWLSSPVSGPARFDWDAATDSWVYRRTGVNLMRLLEKEIGELCGTPVDLS
uniref:ferroxidase n=1 Tax=Aegilops tauschii subsp. strangulata TaxID=200361 RepID=A0A453FPG5_AEGTS